MAKFTAEQAHAVVEIQQLINDWGYELDLNNGQTIADLVTEDCVYVVGGAPREGRAGVVRFYAERDPDELIHRGGRFRVHTLPVTTNDGLPDLLRGLSLLM